jgi:hypothetical protein
VQYKSVKTQIAITNEDNVAMVGITDESQEYFLWQVDHDDQQSIYFEYNDQKNSGYNIIQECTVMLDGMHLVLSSDEWLHFYFNDLNRSEYNKLIVALENIYSSQPNILEVVDK